MYNVFDYIHSVFDPILSLKASTNPTETAAFEQFLAELENQQTDSVVARLTVCIAIDLKVKNVTPDDYYTLISKYDWSLPGTLPDNYHTATCDISFYETLLPDTACPAFGDQYVRVMTLSTFERVYLPSIDASLIALGDEDNLPPEKLYLNTHTPIPFRDDGRTTMRGRKECAWVLPYSAINAIVGDDYDSDWADYFVDMAGFYIGTYPDSYDITKSTDPKYRYMYLLYPSEFTETVYKPATIHAEWNGPEPYPYISSAHLDGWGKTYFMDLAVTPAITFLERIHLPFFLFSNSKRGNAYDIRAYGGSSLRRKHNFAKYLDEALAEALFRFRNLP